MKKKNILLIIFFLLHFLIRVYKLTDIPYGFHRDEAYTGYNAYSILKTGKDEWGNLLPIFSRSFGDYPPALILYFTIPFIKIFGLNEFGVRFSTVFFSCINYILFYKILKKLKLKDGLVYLTLILLSLSPWEITQVRGANGDLILGILFFLLGVNFFISFLQKPSTKYLLWGTGSWLLTYFSYNSFRLQTPLLIIPLIILIYNFKKNRNSKRATFLLSLLLIFPLFFPFLFPGSAIRINQTLFINDSLKTSIDVLATRSKLMNAPLILARIFHNKISYILFSFTKNFIRLSSFDFLYLYEAVPRRFSVPENGLLLFFTAPFLILGAIFFGSNKFPLKYKIILGYLVVVGILPSVITQDDFPNSKRSFLAFYPLIFIIAYGVYEFHKRISYKKIFSGVLIIGFLLNFSYFWYFYKYQSPFLVSHSRNYFYKQISEVITANKDKYDSFKIYTFSEAPHILMLFYTKFDPKTYHSYAKDNINIDIFANKQEWRFDKFIFSPQECPKPSKNQLIIADLSKCNSLLDKVTANEWEIVGYALSPYGSKEFVYYQLKNNIN